jgi:glycosyltransferase involved in cell wall biosynthesis
MACPVVASCLGALPETLGAAGAEIDASAAGENGVKRLEAGWLFRSLDGEALARALQAALSTPADLLERMGAIARAHAVRNFSKQALQTRTLAVYDRLLGTQLARDFKALAKP